MSRNLNSVHLAEPVVSTDSAGAGVGNKKDGHYQLKTEKIINQSLIFLFPLNAVNEFHFHFRLSFSPANSS